MEILRDAIQSINAFNESLVTAEKRLTSLVTDIYGPIPPTATTATRDPSPSGSLHSELGAQFLQLNRTIQNIHERISDLSQGNSGPRAGN